MTHRAVLAVLVVVSALAVWIYWRSWPEAPIVSADSPSYMRVAQDLSAGGLQKPRIRTPGYPLLLVSSGAAAGPSRTLFALQLLLQAGSVLLACGALLAVGASPGLSLTCGLIGLLPPYVQPSAYMLTETLTQFCLVLGVVCLRRSLQEKSTGWLLAASASFGYAALTRPTFQLVAFVLAVLLLALARRNLADRFRVREAVLLAAGTIALVGGWAAYNEARFGSPGTASTLGFNLANMGPELYEGIPDPTTRRLLIEARNAAYDTGKSVPWAHFSVQPRLAAELGLRGDADVERWLRSQMARAIMSHPIQYAEIVAGSLARFWLPAAGRLPLARERRAQVLWYGVHFALMGLLGLEALAFGGWIMTALAGLRADSQTCRAWTLWTLCAAIAAYNAAISCALETGEIRYRTSAELLLPLAACAGLVATRGLFRSLVAAAAKLSRVARSA